MTAHRLVGEFRPPAELAAMALSRVTGRGAIETTAHGLVVQGRVLVEARDLSRPAASVGALGIVLAAAVFPDSQAVLIPATGALALGVGWSWYRAEVGRPGAYEVGWADVEHVVRLASARDVVAIVLSRPLGGRGSPETLYFAPSLGVEALAAALRDAPSHVTVDLESGLADGPPTDTDTTGGDGPPVR